MQSFSQRIGLKPIRTVIQRESADEALRNFLWNGLTIFYFKRFGSWLYETDEGINTLVTRIWVRYYGNRIDELDNYLPNLILKLKKDFINSDWNEMFDILEFIPNNYKEAEHKGGFNNEINRKFISFANDVLEEHLSAYRFVDSVITEISSEEEIVAVEEALQESYKFKTVHIHLKRALELFSDRKNPDYRNSIKESISAIESFSCIITENPKATLGQALKVIEKDHNLHSALKNSFASLYGYTSDADGIRHSLLEEPNLKQEDAKFMLVACSAFINYLLVKASAD